MSVTDLPMQKRRVGVTIQTTITTRRQTPITIATNLLSPLLTWCRIQIPCLVR
jgi:hypothetical protein